MFDTINCPCMKIASTYFTTVGMIISHSAESLKWLVSVLSAHQNLMMEILKENYVDIIAVCSQAAVWYEQ